MQVFRPSNSGGWSILAKILRVASFELSEATMAPPLPSRKHLAHAVECEEGRHEEPEGQAREVEQRQRQRRQQRRLPQVDAPSGAECGKRDAGALPRRLGARRGLGLPEGEGV
jgi:hypothetical protein